MQISTANSLALQMLMFGLADLLRSQYRLGQHNVDSRRFSLSDMRVVEITGWVVYEKGSTQFQGILLIEKDGAQWTPKNISVELATPENIRFAWLNKPCKFDRTGLGFQFA